MRFNIHGKKLEVTESIKNYIEEKIGRLDKYFENPDDITATVLIKLRGNDQVVEVTVNANRFVLRAEESNKDLYASIDKASDKIERQIRKNKTRMSKKVNKEYVQDFVLDFDEPEENDDVIVRRKVIEDKPMSEDEAILQMELIGHEFFAFRNVDTKDVNIIYKRKDGKYKYKVVGGNYMKRFNKFAITLISMATVTLCSGCSNSIPSKWKYDKNDAKNFAVYNAKLKNRDDKTSYELDVDANTFKNTLNKDSIVFFNKSELDENTTENYYSYKEISKYKVNYDSFEVNDDGSGFKVTFDGDKAISYGALINKNDVESGNFVFTYTIPFALDSDQDRIQTEFEEKLISVTPGWNDVKTFINIAGYITQMFIGGLTLVPTAFASGLFGYISALGDAFFGGDEPTVQDVLNKLETMDKKLDDISNKIDQNQREIMNEMVAVEAGIDQVLLNQYKADITEFQTEYVLPIENYLAIYKDGTENLYVMDQVRDNKNIDEIINNLRDKNMQNIHIINNFTKIKQYDVCVYDRVFAINNYTNNHTDNVVIFSNGSEYTNFHYWELFKQSSKSITAARVIDDYRNEVLEWTNSQSFDYELSIILPVYNVEKYIEQCIKTITSWKAPYIEFIFVDDGSPDNSSSIIEKYIKSDNRIKLFKKTNGGCASARQYGVNQSKGRYIGFVDPDDFIDPTMFQKLLARAMSGTYDISYCGYNEFYEETQTYAPVEDLTGKQFIFGVKERQDIEYLIAYRRIAIWRGIYSYEMIKNNDIVFHESLKRFDDLPFKVETLMCSKSVVSIDEPLYFYRMNRPGQDVSANDERLFVHFEIFKLLEKFINERNIKNTWYLEIIKADTHMWALSKIEDKNLRIKYIQKIKEDYRSYPDFDYLKKLFKLHSKKKYLKIILK